MIDLPEDFMTRISWKQREVLSRLMQGKTTDAICEEMCLAEPTVKMHITGLLKAAGAVNRVELVVAALNVELARLRSESDIRSRLASEVRSLRHALESERNKRAAVEARLHGALEMARALNGTETVVAHAAG